MSRPAQLQTKQERSKTSSAEQKGATTAIPKPQAAKSVKFDPEIESGRTIQVDTLSQSNRLHQKDPSSSKAAIQRSRPIVTLDSISAKGEIHDYHFALPQTSAFPTQATQPLEASLFSSKGRPVSVIKSPKSDSGNRLKAATEAKNLLERQQLNSTTFTVNDRDRLIEVVKQALICYQAYARSAQSPSTPAVPSHEVWHHSKLTKESLDLAKLVEHGAYDFGSEENKTLVRKVLRSFHRFLLDEALEQRISKLPSTPEQSPNNSAKQNTAKSGTWERTTSPEKKNSLKPSSLEQAESPPTPYAPHSSPTQRNSDVHDTTTSAESSPVHQSRSETSKVTPYSAFNIKLSSSEQLATNSNADIAPRTDIIYTEAPVTPTRIPKPRPEIKSTHRSASYSLAPSPQVPTANFQSTQPLKSPSPVEHSIHSSDSLPSDQELFEFDDDETFQVAVSVATTELGLERIPMATNRPRKPSKARDFSASHADRVPLVEAKNLIMANNNRAEDGVKGDGVSDEELRVQKDLVRKKDEDLRELQTKLASLEEQLESLTERLEENEEQRAKSESHLARAKEERDLLARDLSKAEQDARSRDETIESQSTELQKAEQALSALQSKDAKKISELEEQKQFAENALAQRTQDCQKLKQQKDALEKSLEQRKRELAQAEEERDDMVNASVQLVDFEREKEELLAEIDTLREQLENKDRTINDMTEDLAQPIRQGVSLFDELENHDDSDGSDSQFSGSDLEYDSDSLDFDTSVDSEAVKHSTNAPKVDSRPAHNPILPTSNAPDTTPEDIQSSEKSPEAETSDAPVSLTAGNDPGDDDSAPNTHSESTRPSTKSNSASRDTTNIHNTVPSDSHSPSVPTSEMNKTEKTKHRRTGTVTPLGHITRIESTHSRPTYKEHKRRSTGSLASVITADRSNERSGKNNTLDSAAKDRRSKRRSTGSIPVPIVDQHKPLEQLIPAIREDMVSLHNEPRQQSLSEMLDEVISPSLVETQPVEAMQIIQRRGVRSHTQPNEERLHATKDGNNVNIFHYGQGTVHAAVSNTGQAQLYAPSSLEQVDLDTGELTSQLESPMLAIVTQTMPIRVIRIGFDRAKNTIFFSMLPWLLLVAVSLWMLNSPGYGAHGTAGYRDDNWLMRNTQSGRDRFREWMDIRPDIAT
jgi:hypothetical protein